jgi:hypothetical protein
MNMESKYMIPLIGVSFNAFGYLDEMMAHQSGCADGGNACRLGLEWFVGGVVVLKHTIREWEA